VLDNETNPAEDEPTVDGKDELSAVEQDEPVCAQDEDEVKTPSPQPPPEPSTIASPVALTSSTPATSSPTLSFSEASLLNPTLPSPSRTSSELSLTKKRKTVNFSDDLIEQPENKRRISQVYIRSGGEEEVEKQNDDEEVD
jgi:hypothetical protein